MVPIEKKKKIEEALNLFAGGRSLRDSISFSGFDRGTFLRAISLDPALIALFEAASRSRAEMIVDDIIAIADDEPDANRARVRVDARKWYASKMMPQKFGDRIDVNVNQTVDIGSALSDARARLRPACDPAQIATRQVIEITSKSMHSASGSKPDSTPESGNAPDITGEDIFD